MFDKLKDKWSKANGIQKAGIVAGGIGAAATAPVWAPIAAAASPIAGAVAGGKKFHKDRVNRPGWNRKQMLRADMQRLQEGPQALGMSDDERQRMLDDQMEASNAQAQAQQQAIAQQALAGGEFQQDTFAQAQQQAAEAQQGAAAQAQAAVESENQKQINQEANRIRGEIAQRQAENEAKTKYWLDKGINLATQIAMMAGGLPPMAAGAGTGAMSSGPAPTENQVEGVDLDVLDQMSNESW